MKKGLFILGMAGLTALAAGCTTAYQGSSAGVPDDLYAVHSRTEIARKQQAEAEARKAEAEARRAELEARIAEANAASAERSYYNRSSNDSYTGVLADDYESAYARRLRGFESPSYRMPSSYLNARYSSAFTYASAYDPAFYNVIVMGDEVWVEPKYVTAMFGTWGRPVYTSAWYYGWPSYSSWWGSPSFSIGFGGWGWNIGLSWFDPWWGWGRPWWDYGYGWGWHRPPYYHPHWGPGHGGHRPGWGVVHRPSGPRRTYTYGGSAGSRINRSQSGNRNWSSGVYQGGGNRRNPNRGGSVSRTERPTGGSSSNRYGGSYDSGNSQRRSSQSGSTYRPSQSGGYSSGSSSRGGSYGGGGSHSGGGGSSRGGYSGSSSRGR